MRVILTTNFDRLMEQALSELGVAPQVIDRPSAASAMTPLCHSPVTIVKLHGDYLSTELRNTAEELTSYPPEWLRLLHQIFDEYGLVVVGWSGDYDVALADCVSDVVNRRYPMYWGARNGHISEAAQRIIQRRSAYKIPLASADEFLCDLRDQVVRLNVLAKRRPRFAIHRHPERYPDWAAPPWSWSAIPALVIRAHASLEPATDDQVGLIGPETREHLIEVLTNSVVIG